MIITLLRANFANSNIGLVNDFAVLTNLGMGLSYEGDNSVPANGAFAATIRVLDGYSLIVDSLSVTMGGVALSNADVFSINGKEISVNIPVVTGVISLVGAAKSALAGMLLNFDFTKKTLEDYVTEGIIFNKNDYAVITGTYDSNGLNFTNKDASHGYALTNPIPVAQNFTFEITVSYGDYNAELTSKKESLYYYTMFISGADDHELHDANCFTPAIFNNNPNSNIRKPGGSTLNTGANAKCIYDGQMHTYKYNYIHDRGILQSFVDGELKNEQNWTFTEGNFGYILGAHMGYSSALNYGFTAGMAVKSLKLWQEQ